MLYLTNDVAELIASERAAELRRLSRQTPRPAHAVTLGDAAMIWIVTGLAAAFALVLWL